MARRPSPEGDPEELTPDDRPLVSNADLKSWFGRFRAALTSAPATDDPAAGDTAAPKDELTRVLRVFEDVVKQQSRQTEKYKTRLATYERELAELRERVAGDATTIERLTQTQSRVEALLSANQRHRRLLDTLDRKLDRARIADSIEKSVAAAEVEQDPSLHVYLTDLLPKDFYELLLETMPPPECFRYADPTKQDFEPHDGSLVPDLSRVVWSFFEDEVVDKMLGPALLARFRPFVSDHYARIFGPEYAAEAAAWPQRARGRLMLRRPGYFLAPHLDPKKVLFTTLIYFARPGDNEDHGTQLYRVDRPFQASSLKTYYPQQHGYQCELARTVPFRPNTGFAFMNGEAAHGANIPPDSDQTERYAYQFYTMPAGHDFVDLVRRLPPDRRDLFEGVDLTP